MAGKHLLIDASSCDCEKLADFDAVYEFLLSSPKLVGLLPLGLPDVVKATDKGADGLTGVQKLTTSHLTIHTWTSGPRTGFAHMDCFSCEDFDESKLVAVFRAVFSPKISNIRIVPRI